MFDQTDNSPLTKPEMNTKTKIAISCFLGGSIGALFALQFSNYFWWAGVLIGAVIGYIGYDFKKLCKVFKKEWKNAIDIFLEEISNFFVNAFTVVVAGIFFALCIVFVIFSFSSLIYSANESYKLYTQGINHFDFSLICHVLGTIVFMVCVYFWFEPDKKSPIFLVTAFLFSPLGLIASPPILALCVVCVVAWLLYRFTKLFFKVSVATFFAVHSDIRLLCMTDSLIGATSGYLLGNAIVGGVIGAVSGLINYELVSVRWLKIVVRK